MLPADFRFHAPTSLDEALRLVAEDEDEDGSTVLAGGMSMMPD